MNIIQLDSSYQQALEHFLQDCDACLFMRSNALSSGLEYANRPFHGEYFAKLNAQQQLLGVLAHYWNNTLMMHCTEPSDLVDLLQYWQQHKRRPVTGLLGEAQQIDCAIQTLGLDQADFKLKNVAPLYTLLLNTLTPLTPQPHYLAEPAQATQRPQLQQWFQHYDQEALHVDSTTARQQAQARVDQALSEEGKLWVLKDKGEMVCMCGINARLPDCLQLGPVWTPPAYRNRGYARYLIQALLQDAQTKVQHYAQLFTNNPAAQRAYQAVGFKPTGQQFTLAFLKKPAF